LLFLVGCDQKPAATVPAPAPSAQRLVSLSPALGVIGRDLGIADRFVGRDSYDMALPKSLPVCGDLRSVDYEQLLRVNPTHILTQFGKLERPRRLAEMAKERGWIVQELPQLTLADIRETTQTLAVLTGTQDRGLELLAQMDKAWTKQPGAERAGTILLLESVTPPGAVGPGSWHHELLERLGATPALRTGGPFVNMDLEDLLHLAPGGIILFLPRPPGTDGPNVIEGEPALVALGAIARLDIPAVKRARVAVITDPLGLTPSTAMIGVAEEMAQVLREWSDNPASFPTEPRP